MQRQLIESEGFAVKLLNASRNGLYVHDVRLGQDVFINPRYAALTGYTLDDLGTMGKAQFLELFHQDDRQRVVKHMEKLVGGLKWERRTGPRLRLIIRADILFASFNS